MASFQRGKVVRVIESSERLVRALVALDTGEIPAAGFPHMVGPIAAGDAVIVNTTGIDLDLGTGGEAFILWNLDGPGPPGPGEGHIVKLRYTPWQTEVLSVEAPESPHHEMLRTAERIDGVPVIACGLHSQIAGVAAGIKAEREDARVGYLMTDGAALPLQWSRLVKTLRDQGLIDVSCTSGHAFGGDMESVNVFSGFTGLAVAGSANVIIAAMGPGVVGTGTALGFTALEQGQLLDAASAMGGRALACLRVSFTDERARHVGISHHTITALRIAARERSTVVLPALGESEVGELRAQLEESGIDRRHNVVVADGTAGVALLRDRNIAPTSMGKSIDEVPELFLAAAAAGRVAAESL